MAKALLSYFLPKSAGFSPEEELIGLDISQHGESIA